MAQRSASSASSKLFRFGGGVVAAALTACGGGTGTGTEALAPVTPPVAAPSAISGTVAVGAPMLNAVITVKDALGATRTATAGADGSYHDLSTDGMTAPFSVQACGIVDGSNACYYSVVAEAGTANVTPLTHAAISLALGRDAAALFTGDAAAPTSAELEAQNQKLVTALGPVLAAVGVAPSTDFATSAFTADRTGMDKVLDAVKISTGTDKSSTGTPTAFVQVEGKIGAGNVYLGSDGTADGTLGAGAGLEVDLRGISTVFAGLTDGVSSATAAECASRMAAAKVIDPAFSLHVEGTAADAASAPALICGFAEAGQLLGGTFANPVLKDCDFSGADKVCVVGFAIVKGDVVFDGAQLAVVQHSGSAEWKLLGDDSAYDINVSAAAQRSVRVDLPDVAATYSRALSFDISNRSDQPVVIRAAKVFQHNLSGQSWEHTPLITLALTDECLAQTARLAVDGSGCEGSWLSIDAYGHSAADGDALIDNFYKRGRQVRIDLYADVAATLAIASVVKRIDGVPPKSSALADFPWLELDAASKAALASYDGAASTFTATWAANRTVSPHDITFCLSGNCSDANRAAHEDLAGNATSKTLTLTHAPAGASAYKQLSLYGRNREHVGISTNYVSCGGDTDCQQ